MSVFNDEIESLKQESKDATGLFSKVLTKLNSSSAKITEAIKRRDLKARKIHDETATLNKLYATNHDFKQKIEKIIK